MLQDFKFVDGVKVPMTKEEIAQAEADRVKYEEWLSENPPVPTETERIAELESKLESFESAYRRGVNEA